MTPLHLDRFQRWARGHLLCHVDDPGPRFALTFDDGPSPRNTPALLDVLAGLGARATFFLLRSPLRRSPELARRMLRDGHEVGVHGDLHLPAWAMPTSWIGREIERSVATMRDALGIMPRHYRAPFGLLLPRQAATVRACGLVPVLGDVYPADHALRRSEPIVSRVLRRLDRGSIVILHDSGVLGDPDRGPTVAAVGAIVEAGARRGLGAVTIAELSAGR